jgi:autotransporter-associated beta strand protein
MTGDTAEFEASNITDISVDVSGEVDEWRFDPGATQYYFDIPFGIDFDFFGSGITINAGSVHIFNFGQFNFASSSTAGGALIDNFGLLQFVNTSKAGGAAIHTFGGGGQTLFEDFSTGGSAQLVTDAGGIVDFSNSIGPNGHGDVTAGSIAGAGDYVLGADQLTVGLNGLSTGVSGPISVTGGSLVKVGPGTLTLSHAGNTYSGGTGLVAGTLDLAAVEAAGTGPVAFGGAAKLEIKNAALSGHVFVNLVDFFGEHDVLDLAGLKFRHGASAKYHPASHHLTVRSGGVTDTLTLFPPLGKHFGVETLFTAANDGHGGTKVVLDPPHHTAAVASLSAHEVAEQHWAANIAGSASHLSDFLLTA